MIVRDLDVIRIPAPPVEANPPLIIDPDAVVPSAVSRESFQSVPRRNTQVLKRPGRVQHCEFTLGYLLDIRSQFPGLLSQEDLLSLLVPEAPDHIGNNNVRR